MLDCFWEGCQMKRWIFCVAAMILLFGLSACSFDSGRTSGKESSSSSALSFSESSDSSQEMSSKEPDTQTDLSALEDLILIPASKNQLWGFVDETDEVKIPFLYQETGTFSEGLCRVLDEDTGKWGYIDKTGEIGINFLYDDAKDFHDGAAMVKRNGLWGLIDSTGQTITDPLYQDCKGYGDGLFAVKLNGYWGFIDTDGNTAIDFLYTDLFADGFEYGRCFISINGAWGAILSDGTFLVSPAQGAQSLFYNGEAFFQIGSNVYNQQGTLLRSGNFIWHADGDRCLVYSEEGTAEIIDAGGNTVADLCQTAIQTLPASASVGIYPVSQRNDSLYYGFGNWLSYDGSEPTVQMVWDDWILIQAIDPKSTSQGSRSRYYNLINLQGELFWDSWKLENYQQEYKDRLAISMYRNYALVSDLQGNFVEVWDLTAKTSLRFDGVLASNLYLWNDFFVTPKQDDGQGRSLCRIYSLKNEGEPYFVSSALAIDENYLQITEENGIFYGLLAVNSGVLTEAAFPEYTRIDYQSSQNLITLERGAETTVYWIAPSGALILQ